MKVAVASTGTVPEALVGVRFGLCSQFLVFDLDTMEYVVVSVPPRQEPRDEVNLAAIRAVAGQGVQAIIAGDMKEICRQTLFDLGIEVIDGVEGMTVAEAVERYRTGSLQAPGERRGYVTRVAAASQGEGLDAPLGNRFGVCTSFVIVDPQTMEWETLHVEPDGPDREVNLKGIRAVARSGVYALITPEVHPECCMALRALAIRVYLAPAGISVREAIERYQRGDLEETFLSPF